MIFIFEDHEEDIISKFFKKAYPDNVSNKFIYARGNAYIKGIADSLLNNTNDEIVIYLDTIPGNKETYKIYRELQKMSIQNQYRLIVLPIVCMEYYLIKALNESQVMISQIGVDLCINKDLYFNSPLISSISDKVFVKNFEKYCKLILIKNLKDCASHSGKTIKDCYGVYYIYDCLCKFRDDNCVKEKLIDKLAHYLLQYDCIPAGSIVESRSLDLSEVWDIHRKLVKEYNDMVNYYISSGITDISQYKTITVIQ